MNKFMTLAILMALAIPARAETPLTMFLRLYPQAYQPMLEQVESAAPSSTLVVCFNASRNPAGYLIVPPKGKQRCAHSGVAVGTAQEVLRYLTSR